MAQATGALTKITGLTQTALRALPAEPAAEVLYVQTLDFNDNQTIEQDATLGGGFRGELEGEEGRRDASGSAVVTLGTSIAFWLKHLIGVPATTDLGTEEAPGPYQHVFRVSAEQPMPVAQAIERDFTSRIATPGRYVRNTDVRIESAAFAFATTSPYQQVTFNLRGASKRSLPAAPMDATPADYGHAAFGLAGLSLLLDNGDTEVCVESTTMNWNNDLDTDLYCLNDGGVRHDLPEGTAQITGEGVAQFDTPALLIKAEADESLALRLTFTRGTGAGTAGNEQLVFDIPLSKFLAPTPGVTGPRGLKQNFSWRAYRLGGQEVAVSVTLKSPRAIV
ncbi:phage tail tube protein [Stenotrophomonas sp. MMGLT7]|uniref:phage tail tube protein n=1 Tax=Stenotrophomonas sp. MMGLT7 TaxID=2901227 RepID=UPI001E649E2A|nr:phage tail tube protein [Stenotrophomonas sp. MMGLT7]MCD7096937.1 phage tail tube protein [Stenotrophomonas sp. MMGLT7]